MKKIICLLIAALMLCSFAPCAFAETVEDYVFSDFESEGEIHKWGSGWNDTLLYYTEEGAAGYPDSNNKTVTLTIDGKSTTLYGRYVTTADSTVTRPGFDYSLKWDKIGKKAPGGAFRDSDETNGRIESHGKKWLYDDRLSLKKSRSLIIGSEAFNPDTMMQWKTPVFDMSNCDYSYLNMWIYSNEKTDVAMSVKLNFARKIGSASDEKCNYNYYLTPDWNGWKLISIPLWEFVAPASGRDSTYPTYFNAVAFNYESTEAEKLPDGYYLNFDSIWMSQSLPEGATDVSADFYVFDAGSSADESFVKNWINSWNHRDGGLTPTDNAREFVPVWAAEEEIVREGKNYALRWDNIDKNGLAQAPGDYWINATTKRTVARNILRYGNAKNASSWPIGSYDYLNLWVYSGKKTGDDIKLILTNYTDSEARVEKYTASIPVGWENEWILLSIAKSEISTKDGTGTLESAPDYPINGFEFKIINPSSDTLLLFDSMYFSKKMPDGAVTIADITPEEEPDVPVPPIPGDDEEEDGEEEVNGDEFVIADFTDGSDYGFKAISVSNYEGFSVSGDIDKETFEFPAYKWQMSKAVATSSGNPTSRFYLSKEFDLSKYKGGYLNMRMYSPEATGKMFVVVLGSSTPRSTGSGTADYRTSNEGAHLIVDWTGWKNISFKLGTKTGSSDANTIGPLYYASEPEKGYYSDINFIQLQNGGYNTYVNESPAQTLYIDSIWASNTPALDDVVVKAWESEQLISSDMTATEYSDVSVTDNTISVICDNTFSNSAMTFNVENGLLEIKKNGTILTDGWSAKALGSKFKIAFDNKLDFASKYEIILKEGLKASHGATLKEEKKLILNTQSEAPVLDDVKIYEGTSEIANLNGYSGGELKIEASVSGVSEAAKAVFITCVYDEATNEMLAMFSDDTCENGKFSNSVAGFNDFEGKYINCFMWNTLEGMQILSSGKIIK